MFVQLSFLKQLRNGLVNSMYDQDKQVAYSLLALVIADISGIALVLG